MIKALLILFFLGCALQTFGQHKLNSISYVDGIPLNSDVSNAFNAKEIKNQRTALGSFRDTVFITLKDHKLLYRLLNKKRLSLYQIALQNIAGFTKNSPVIFFRNDTLLLDTAGVRIPELSVFQPTVLRAVKTSYYQNFTGATFFYIYTKPQPLYIK